MDEWMDDDDDDDDDQFSKPGAYASIPGKFVFKQDVWGCTIASALKALKYDKLVVLVKNYFFWAISPQVVVDLKDQKIIVRWKV